MSDFNTPFDYVEDIKNNTLPDADFKAYSPLIAIRALSMNFKNLPLCSMVSKYTFLGLSNEQHYQLIYNLPWYKERAKWIKKTGTDDKIDEIVDILSAYWSHTTIKREEYYQMLEHGLLTESDMQSIMEQSGIDPKKIKSLLKSYKKMRKNN